MADVDPVNNHSATGEFVGMTTWTTPDIKHPLSRPQVQMTHQEVNLLNSPLRK
jgi:hypothetical protein